MIQFVLPVKALSVNAAYRGRHFKTPACKSFEEEVWYLIPRDLSPVCGEVEISLNFYLKNYKKTDVSNLVKILEDILVKRELIEDDRKVKVMRLEKHKAEKDSIRVEIKEYNCI